MRLLVVFILFVFYHVDAQIVKQEQSNWLAYTGQIQLTSKWSHHLETQIRMDGDLERNIQNLFRTGGVYKINENKNAAVGFAYIKTFSANYNKYFNENRVWQQFQINKKWNLNKYMASHRFRLEQRWVETPILSTNKAIAETFYQNRFRYLNRNLFRLANNSTSQKELYGVLQNEFFFNLGKNKINDNIFDQNRFLIGLGVNSQNNSRFELGYLNHFITSNVSNNLIRHTVSFSIQQNLDFTAK